MLIELIHINSLPQITEIYTITFTQKKSHRNFTTDHTITVSTVFFLVVFFLMEYYLGKGKLLTGHLRKENEKWFIIFNYPSMACFADKLTAYLVYQVHIVWINSE